MSSTHSEIRIDFANALKELEARLTILDARLQAESGYPQWIWKVEGRMPARDQARAVIRATDYIDGQDPHETRICPALLGVSHETLAAARAVNQAKMKLDAALRAIDALTESVIDEITGVETKQPLLKAALASLKRARFHRRQALRKLVVLDRAPEKVSYTWARLNKVERTTRDELVGRLEQWMEEQGFSQDRQHDLGVLKSLTRNEPLAEVRPPHIHPRANIVTRCEDHVERTQVRAVLPLLYPAEPGDRIPLHRALPPEAPSGDKRRRGRPQNPESKPRVSTTRILKSLPVYRYLW